MRGLSQDLRTEQSEVVESGLSPAISAFSLVEVLASIVILGVSLFVLYEMLYQGAISWEYAENESEVVQNGRVALERMAGEIRQAKKLYNNPPGNTYTDGNSIEFWYDIDYDDVEETGERISFSVDVNNNLMRETWDIDRSPPPSPQPMTSDILANFIKNITFEYRLADNTVISPPLNGQDDIDIININLALEKVTQPRNITYEIKMRISAYPRNM